MSGLRPSRLCLHLQAAMYKHSIRDTSDRPTGPSITHLPGVSKFRRPSTVYSHSTLGLIGIAATEAATLVDIGLLGSSCTSDGSDGSDGSEYRNVVSHRATAAVTEAQRP